MQPGLPAPSQPAAVGELDADEVTLALRMLQPLALPRTTRARADAMDGILHDLRAAITDATGAPDLKREALERVRPRTWRSSSRQQWPSTRC